MPPMSICGDLPPAMLVDGYLAGTKRIVPAGPVRYVNMEQTSILEKPPYVTTDGRCGNCEVCNVELWPGVFVLGYALFAVGIFIDNRLIAAFGVGLAGFAVFVRGRRVIIRLSERVKERDAAR